MKAKEFLEILGNMKTHHGYKVKNGNKCSGWVCCSEPYRIYKKLEKKLEKCRKERLSEGGVK